MKRLSIQDIIRCSHVNRWQIVRTLRQQNIAEHQYMVTMIALEIAEKVMGDKFLLSTRLDLMNWSLRHDLREVMFGDICTPVKQRIRSRCGKNVFEEIERDICRVCNKAESEVAGTVVMEIVKLADLIDGIRFLTLEGHGKHAEAVLHKLTIIYMKRAERVAKNYTGYDWSALNEVYSAILSDECGYLKFENIVEE